MRSGLASAVVGMSVLWTAGALADVPPPPDYVEECTLERVQRPGQACLVCTQAYHGDRSACERLHAKDGYARQCQTAGASTWDELWCQPAPPDAPPSTPPPAGKSGSCGACALGTQPWSSSAALLALSLGGLLLWRRRRR